MISLKEKLFDSMIFGSFEYEVPVSDKSISSDESNRVGEKRPSLKLDDYKSNLGITKDILNDNFMDQSTMSGSNPENTLNIGHALNLLKYKLIKDQNLNDLSSIGNFSPGSTVSRRNKFATRQYFSYDNVAEASPSLKDVDFYLLDRQIINYEKEYHREKFSIDFDDKTISVRSFKYSQVL